MSTLTAKIITPLLTPQQVLTQCAYHEAGHGFAFSVYGIPCNGITVKMRKRFWSKTYSYEALTHTNTTHKVLANQADVAVCVLAGIAAESLYMAKMYAVDFDATLAWYMRHEASNWRDMIDFDEALSNATPRYSRSRAIHDTASLVKRHWRRIDKIATRVIKKEYLSGPQVRRMAGV